MPQKVSPWKIFISRRGKTLLYMFLGLLLAIVSVVFDQL